MSFDEGGRFGCERGMDRLRGGDFGFKDRGCSFTHLVFDLEEEHRLRNGVPIFNTSKGYPPSLDENSKFENSLSSCFPKLRGRKLKKVEN